MILETTKTVIKCPLVVALPNQYRNQYVLHHVERLYLKSSSIDLKQPHLPLNLLNVLALSL